MQITNVPGILFESAELISVSLNRTVKVDFYYPQLTGHEHFSLLLINDGQDMPKMNFSSILSEFYQQNEQASPLFCAAIHCSANRKQEYGVAGVPDYLGRGAKAGEHTAFVLEELLPYISKRYPAVSLTEKSYAGFSLGGLSAFDMVWTHPTAFKRAGVFSGSLWWRSVDQFDKKYDDDQHRIIHQQVRKGEYHPGLKFFFQCGNMDETKDRNKNGIIDSIDDTLDLIRELEEKGYKANDDIVYLEFSDGHHDVPTWGRAFPYFLKWGWGKSVLR